MGVLSLGGVLAAACQTKCARGVPREERAGAGAHQCAMFQGGERLEVLVAFRRVLLVFREQQADIPGAGPAPLWGMRGLCLAALGLLRSTAATGDTYPSLRYPRHALVVLFLTSLRLDLCNLFNVGKY